MFQIYKRHIPFTWIQPAALNAQGVLSASGLYVKDYKPEADEVRAQDFTSFLTDPGGYDTDKQSIQRLKQWIDFVEK